MKIKYLVILFIGMVWCTSVGWAQETVEGLPDDLDSAKIIFLQYEPIDMDPRIPYEQRKRNKERNILGAEANKQLKVAAKEYPFQYKISNRSEYVKLVEEGGYKYVLENDMMNAYNYGERVNAGAGKVFAANMYLRDLSDGTRYELFTIKQNLVYDYEKIMKTFNKMVKKEYDL